MLSNLYQTNKNNKYNICYVDAKLTSSKSFLILFKQNKEFVLFYYN